MLAWHILEGNAALEFTSGTVREWLSASEIMHEQDEIDRNTSVHISGFEGFDDSVIQQAKSAKPWENICVKIIDLKDSDEYLVWPLEISIWLEKFDWEEGAAEGSLQGAVLFAPDTFDSLQTHFEKAYLSVDLKGLCFSLSYIEMLAPAASPPPASIDSTLDGNAKSGRPGGPGRRRKHDWDGALLHLVGEAERNAIAPDPDAHGAQADIAARLADWFAEQGQEIPVNSRLQHMARRVLDNVKAANPDVK